VENPCRFKQPPDGPSAGGRVGWRSADGAAGGDGPDDLHAIAPSARSAAAQDLGGVGDGAELVLGDPRRRDRIVGERGELTSGSSECRSAASMRERGAVVRS
jgi:hypothetical protein